MKRYPLRWEIRIWDGITPGYPYSGAISYDEIDPYAVRLAFLRGNRETAVYVFGRDLLAEGLEQVAGDGDVVVTPDQGNPDYLLLSLVQDDAYPMFFYLERQAIDDFTRAMYARVPMGTESAHLADWDAELVKVLGGEA